MTDDWWIYALIIIGMGLVVYRRMTFKRKVYRRTPDREFPEQWRQILRTRVPFYQRLSIADKKKFENEVHIFLVNFQMVGEGTEVTDLDRMLVASGAVIPTFRLEKWHYTGLKRIVIFPERFQIPETDKMASGLVGWGAMEGQLWLSRKAVYKGFHIDDDQKNVVIHECIHLMDMQDGIGDGMLGQLMDREQAEQWMKLIKKKSERIGNGISSVREYAKANPVEFLAVVGESYFETPDKLRREDPELFQAVNRIFNPNENWY